MDSLFTDCSTIKHIPLCIAINRHSLSSCVVMSYLTASQVLSYLINNHLISARSACHFKIVGHIGLFTFHILMTNSERTTFPFPLVS